MSNMKDTKRDIINTRILWAIMFFIYVWVLWIVLMEGDVGIAIVLVFLGIVIAPSIIYYLWDIGKDTID